MVPSSGLTIHCIGLHRTTSKLYRTTSDMEILTELKLHRSTSDCIETRVRVRIRVMVSVSVRVRLSISDVVRCSES